MFGCAKQNAAIKTATDTCLLLAKQTLSDLVRQRPSSLIINFEQVIKSFLVWNIHFTFFLPAVDGTFLLEYWRVSRLNIAQTSSLCNVAGF